MLQGFLSIDGSMQCSYEFRNGFVDEKGLSAEYRLLNGIDDWANCQGRFPFYDGVEKWYIVTIVFVVS